MLIVVLIGALLSAAVHYFIFVLECFRFSDPKVHHGIFRVSADNAEIIKSWAYNQGFYNLFLAIGATVGAAILFANPPAAWALILLSCGSMFTAALVLVITDRNYLPAATKQGLFPALTLLAAAVNAF